MPAALPQLAQGAQWPTRLDGLDWSAGLFGTTFGVRVGVRVDNPALLPKIRQQLPLDWEDSESPVVDFLYSLRGGDEIPGTRIRRFYMAFKGPCIVVRTLDEFEALYALQDAIYFDLSLATPAYSFVHAAVVGWKGRAIVVPGTSCSGKSQLALALLRAGATYYSDDIAPIDCNGRVHPVPRAIGVRDEAGVNRATPPETFGVPVGTAPLPIGLVVSTRYERGAAWQPRHGSAGEAVMVLMEHAVGARVAPADTLRILARAVQGTTVLEGSRGEADMMARELLNALEVS